jgi:hypothetical protein
VFSDSGKIVRIVKDVSAGSCQVADIGQKLWTEPLFQATKLSIENADGIYQDV